MSIFGLVSINLWASFVLPVFLWAASTAPGTVTAVFDDGTEDIPVEGLNPGESRMIEIEHGNNSVRTEVWGFNARLPEVLINEFSTKGDKRNPDRTEIYVAEDGNLCGMVLTNGKEVFMFPDTEVKAGEYLVYNWKTGLPANNGKIQLRRDPSKWSEVLDSVEYTDKSSKQSTATRTMSRRLGKDGLPIDTDSAQDWYITVTRGQSFGQKNTAGEYIPAAK